MQRTRKRSSLKPKETVPLLAGLTAAMVREFAVLAATLKASNRLFLV